LDRCLLYNLLFYPYAPDSYAMQSWIQSCMHAYRHLPTPLYSNKVHRPFTLSYSYVMWPLFRCPPLDRDITPFLGKSSCRTLLSRSQRTRLTPMDAELLHFSGQFVKFCTDSQWNLSGSPTQHTLYRRRLPFPRVAAIQSTSHSGSSLMMTGGGGG
jgi:hypothetical protein